MKRPSTLKVPSAADGLTGVLTECNVCRAFRLARCWLAQTTRTIGVMAVTLDDILAKTRITVADRMAAMTRAELLARAAQTPAPRDFIGALQSSSPGAPTSPTSSTSRTSATRIIAEIKRRSPSAGLIRPEYDGAGFSPEIIARQYHTAGAAAISCLTDEAFFSGHLSFIARIKGVIPLPVLRKDFLIDSWQLAESRVASADAVLLIAECLPGGQLGEMAAEAHELGLATLIEVHDEENAVRALRIVERNRQMALLGVNNRDLTTMKVDLEQTCRIAEMIPRGLRSVLVSESGIKKPDDLAGLRKIGVERVLVGEHLMRHPQPGDALRALLS